MISLAIIISAMISAQINADPNPVVKKYLIEGSTMGIRMGFNCEKWRFFARLNGDYSAEQSSSLEKENDSITYNHESGIGYTSNLQFGLGLDKLWKYERSELGIRTEFAYIYPFTNTNEHLRYNNIIISNFRVAIIADHSVGPISIGGSLGPTATWYYQHYIYEQKNSEGEFRSLNRSSNKIVATIMSELFARYEF